MDIALPIALAGLIIGLAKGGLLGPIAGALILPLLSQTMTVSEAVGVTLPLLMFADVFAVRFFWREWDLKYIRLMLPVALIGVVMGTTLLASLSDNTLRVILGILTLLIVAYKLFSASLSGQNYTHRKWHGYLAGWGSGFASSLANAGGPPVTAYLLLQGINPTTFVGTLALFFAVLNWTKVPGFFLADIMDLDLLLSIIWVLPIIPFGVWLGRKGVGWINPKAFDGLMTFLLLIAALILLFVRGEKEIVPVEATYWQHTDQCQVSDGSGGTVTEERASSTVTLTIESDRMDFHGLVFDRTYSNTFTLDSAYAEEANDTTDTVTIVADDRIERHIEIYFLKNEENFEICDFIYEPVR